MTHAVLTARLAAAGLDPALFSPGDLTRINRALRDMPPVPALPVLVSAPLPGDDVLMAKIDAAAQRCLDALGAESLLFAFDRAKRRERLCEACMAISDALSGWMRRAEAQMDGMEAACAASAASIEAGQALLHELACLHAAARIAGRSDADEYHAALVALEALVTEAEAALSDAGRAVDALARLFGTHLPDLLEAAYPLFADDAEGFSPADFRRAALVLRKAAHPASVLCHTLRFAAN